MSTVVIELVFLPMCFRVQPARYAVLLIILFTCRIQNFVRVFVRDISTFRSEVLTLLLHKLPSSLMPQGCSIDLLPLSPMSD
jgi:hypothetical protein